MGVIWLGRDERECCSEEVRGWVGAKWCSADCQGSGCVLFGGDVSGDLAACSLRNCGRRATAPAEPGLLLLGGICVSTKSTTG